MLSINHSAILYPSRIISKIRLCPKRIRAIFVTTRVLMGRMHLSLITSNKRTKIKMKTMTVNILKTMTVKNLETLNKLLKIKTHIRDRLPRPRGKLLRLEQPVLSSSGYPSTVAEVAPAAVTEAAPAAVAAGAQDIAKKPPQSIFSTQPHSLVLEQSNMTLFQSSPVDNANRRMNEA
jgi:hypothetical protein